MVNSSARRLDRIFHALADSTRRSILRDLAGQEMTVSTIARPHKMSLAAVSKHLTVLESAELIARRKQGSYQYITLNPKTLKSAEQWLLFYQEFWDSRLDTLKDLLEKENT